MPISREDNEDKKDAKLASKRRELGNLYPTPKTYDQLRKDREQSNKLHAARMPKYIILSTSIKTYSAVIATALMLSAVPVLVNTNAFSGTFLSFLLGLLVYGYAIWMMGDISRSFEKLTLNSTPFFLFYIGIYPALAFVLYKFIAHLPVATWTALLTCLHFTVVYALIKLIMKHAQTR